MPTPTLQQIDDARNEMIFREEQLHTPTFRLEGDPKPKRLYERYDKARDAYLTLLMEYRLSQLQEVK